MVVVMHFVVVDIAILVNGRSTGQVRKSFSNAVVNGNMWSMSWLTVVSVKAVSRFMSLVDGGTISHLGKGSIRIHCWKLGLVFFGDWDSVL